MSSQKVPTLIAAIENNPKLKEKISQAKTTQEIEEVLRAEGLQIESKDLSEAVREQMPSLSDEELESVTSGTTPLIIASVVVAK